MRFGKNPFTVLEVFALLGYFADVDFRIEVCGKRFPVVACIAVDNIEIMNLVKMVLCSMSRKYACHPRIESASQACRQSCFPKTVVVGPLPAVFILRLLRRF